MVAIKPSKGDRIFDIVNFIVMLICTILVAYPLIFIVSASFSDPTMVQNGSMVFLPKGFTLEGYKTLFKTGSIWLGYKNTIIYTIFGTAINMLVTISCGYSMSRKDFMLGGIIMKLFMVTMFFNGGMIPTYILMKNLGLLDTVWAMIIPGAFSVYNMIMCRTFFQMNIPKELLEAATVDGCTDMTFFMKIVLPLSGSIVAVMLLFFAVGHWNSYFNGLIYLRDRKLFSLQMVLQEILVQKDMSGLDSSMSAMADSEAIRRQMLADSIKYGVIIVGSLPVMVLYPFVQKFFVKGVMMGSVKG